MRRILFCISNTLLVLGIMSCGGIESNLNSIYQEPIPPEMFYQTTGSCERGDLSFVVLVGAGTLLWTDPAQILVAQTELYINSDRTYTAQYREFDFYNQVYAKSLSDKYEVNLETGKIIFSGLGTGYVVRNQGNYYLELQYEVNFNSNKLQGQIAQFRLMTSIKGYNTDRATYCNLAH